MKLLSDKSWHDDCLSSQLIGCYEAELHGPLEQELGEKPKRIVNIGCAEGYYAIGMKLRLPDSEVLAIDIDDNAIEATKNTAAENGVNIQFPRSQDEISGWMNTADFIVCDCEGAEIKYLDQNRFPGLKNATIIVELHDGPGVAATETITERFCGTHKIWFVTEGERNPSHDPILCRLPDDQRWLAVSEGRPCLMHWYIMKPGSGNAIPS